MNAFNLLGVITGPSGKVSNMRVISLLVPIVVVATWAHVSISKMELQPLTDWQVMLALGPVLAKAWQRGRESSELSK